MGLYINRQTSSFRLEAVHLPELCKSIVKILFFVKENNKKVLYNPSQENILS